MDVNSSDFEDFNIPNKKIKTKTIAEPDYTMFDEFFKSLPS